EGRRKHNGSNCVTSYANSVNDIGRGGLCLSLYSSIAIKPHDSCIQKNGACTSTHSPDSIASSSNVKFGYWWCVQCLLLHCRHQPAQRIPALLQKKRKTPHRPSLLLTPAVKCFLFPMHCRCFSSILQLLLYLLLTDSNPPPNEVSLYLKLNSYHYLLVENS